jgi:integrase
MVAEATESRARVANITKRTVDAEPAPERGETRIWDKTLKGFCLRIYPASTKAPEGRRVYGVKYRVGRTQRWFRIGEHGSPWTPDTARDKAKAVLRDAAGDSDQQAVKFERRTDITVSELIDLYLAEGPAAKPKKRAASWAQDASSLNRHVRPLIGDKIARNLRPAEVTRMAKDIAEGATAADVKTRKQGRAIVRGGPTVAMRTAATVSAMFAWAMKHGGLAALSKNPATGASGSLERRPAKERFLSTKESMRLFETLDAMQADKSLSANQADAFRLLMLTGARKTEIAGLRWSEVDLGRSRLVLPPVRTKAGEKTGERRIALGGSAAAILSARRGSNELFVFPAYRGKGHIVGLQKAWERVRTRADLPDLRIHDLRHSFASFAIADGASLFMVAKALGHADTRVTERYAHIAGDALDTLAEMAAARMGRPKESERQGDGEEGSGDVGDTAAEEKADA